MTDHDLVDDAIIKRHEFYQDFLRPAGYCYALGNVMTLDHDCVAVCVGHFDLKQPPPDAAILELAGLVRPQLQRALQLRRQLLRTATGERATLEVLDRLAQALILLDREGRIVWLNPKAEAIFGQRDGLFIRDAELTAAATKDNNQLRRLIRNAIEAALNPRTAPGGTIAINRPSLKHAYRLLVTPLAGATARIGFGAALQRVPVVAVFVADPSVHPTPQAQVLRTLYGLTPAEARLAAALAGGASLRDYAERSALSLHYVRWLLKQVESKTDTRRITDLIRLLTGQASLLTDDGEPES